jgi:hypothetical protein
MKWITRERPQIDRVGCPWLIRRFVHLMVAYDTLYAWWRDAGDEIHKWKPAAASPGGVL